MSSLTVLYSPFTRRLLISIHLCGWFFFGVFSSFWKHLKAKGSDFDSWHICRGLHGPWQQQGKKKRTIPLSGEIAEKTIKIFAQSHVEKLECWPWDCSFSQCNLCIFLGWAGAWEFREFSRLLEINAWSRRWSGSRSYQEPFCSWSLLPWTLTMVMFLWVLIAKRSPETWIMGRSAKSLQQ